MVQRMVSRGGDVEGAKPVKKTQKFSSQGSCVFETVGLRAEISSSPRGDHARRRLDQDQVEDGRGKGQSRCIDPISRC